MINEKGSGPGCLSVLGIVLIALKLTGLIEWSWLAVLSPFIAEILIFVLIVGFIAWIKK